MSRAAVIPWSLAFVGLGLPLALGGGAGWPYVVFWLTLFGALSVMRPLADASHRLRVQVAAIALVLLVWPGSIVGGLYLVAAAVAWLVIALREADGTVATEP